jgi:hypothetical protein
MSVQIRFLCRFQPWNQRWFVTFGENAPPGMRSELTPAEFTGFVTEIRHRRIEPNRKVTMEVAVPGTNPFKVEFSGIGNVTWGQLVEYLTNCDDSYQAWRAKHAPPPDGQHRERQ